MIIQKLLSLLVETLGNCFSSAVNCLGFCALNVCFWFFGNVNEFLFLPFFPIHYTHPTSDWREQNTNEDGDGGGEGGKFSLFKDVYKHTHQSN